MAKMAQSPLALDAVRRAALWKRLVEQIEEYITGVDRARVAPLLDPGALRTMLQAHNFDQPEDPLAAVDFVVRDVLVAIDPCVTAPVSGVMPVSSATPPRSKSRSDL